MEELEECGIESILLNRAGDAFPHHQTIRAICHEFFDTVSNSVNKETARKHDYSKRIANNAIVIANTLSQIEDLQNESASVALQHKVLEKQINNAFEQQEKLAKEIEEEISREEHYALEIAELEQELNESKRIKVLKWDGIKRVSKAYRSALQFHIQITDSSEAYDKIRTVFFELQKDDDPQYYVDLIRTADTWKVDLIHPSLTPKHEEQLKCVVNFEKQREVSDVTAFLCIIRKVFKQQCKS